MKTENMTFSEALEAMKQGYKVKRASWTAGYIYLKNKDIVYDEEESGGTSVTSPWSVVGPNSPGNLFFFDIIYTQPLASGGATITFNTQTTVYWHEGGSV